MTTALYPPIVSGGHLADWLTASWSWMLLKSPFVPDPTTQTFVSDISGDEITDASYSRVTATTKVTDTSGSTWPVFRMDNPSFGSPVGGEIANYIALYRTVTTDADSPIAAAYPMNHTLSGSPLTVSFVNYADYTELDLAGAWLMTGQVLHPTYLQPIFP